MEKEENDKFVPGDVFQINECNSPERLGWRGCFVMASEIREWGIIGFISWPEVHDKQARAFIRLKWVEIDFVGHAPLVPGDMAEETKGEGE